MSPAAVGLCGIVALLAAILARLPIGPALALTGFLGYAAADGWGRALRMLGSVPYDLASAYSLSVVPLLLLMGAVASRGIMAQELFDAANAVFSGLRGALANATTGACALFGGICGSSIADAAALIPGLILALLYVATVLIVAHARPAWVPRVAAMPLARRLQAAKGMWKLALPGIGDGGADPHVHRWCGGAGASAPSRAPELSWLATADNRRTLMPGARPAACLGERGREGISARATDGGDFAGFRRMRLQVRLAALRGPTWTETGGPATLAPERPRACILQRGTGGLGGRAGTAIRIPQRSSAEIASGGAAVIEARSQADQGAVLLHLRPVIELTDDQFFEFCQLNRDVRIERTAEGDLVIMPPTGGGMGRCRMLLGTLPTQWALQDGTGVTFDSSTGFHLPSGAIRSPDVAWVKRSRPAGLTRSSGKNSCPFAPTLWLSCSRPPIV